MNEKKMFNCAPTIISCVTLFYHSYAQSMGSFMHDSIHSFWGLWQPKIDMKWVCISVTSAPDYLWYNEERYVVVLGKTFMKFESNLEMLKYKPGNGTDYLHSSYTIPWKARPHFGYYKAIRRPLAWLTHRGIWWRTKGLRKIM